MSAFDVAANVLLQKSRTVDSATADTLKLIIDEITRIGFIIDPPPVTQSKALASNPAPPADISVVTYTLTTNNVILSWEQPEDTILIYEVRRGSVWETATRVSITGNLTSILDPITVGTTRFLVKAINESNVYSVTAASVDVVVPPIGTLRVSATVLINNVLLYWTEPTSTFKIDHYTVKKNGSEIANIRSTFLPIAELAGGTYTYTVTPYDIAGNAGPAVDLIVLVNDPPDFINQSSLTSAFSGTKTNAVVEDNNRLLVCVDLTKTWTTHFTSNGWSTPQDQINAGYPVYIEPTLTTASYVEIFDFGVIYTAVILNINYDFQLLLGTMGIGFSTEISDDAISWSAPNVNLNFYAASIRYARITVTYTGGSDKSLLEFYNFRLALTVHLENDGGQITANAGDASGTVVTFLKAFKRVVSITLTSKQLQPITMIYDFTFPANPTTFKVLAYDISGNRITEDITWAARGVI